MAVWFTSDLHLGHEKVLTMADRPFKTIEEMNEALIHAINESVKESDTLWILGDVSYHAEPDRVANLLAQIKCTDVNLCRGNHDQEWLQELKFFTEICDYKELILDGKTAVLMHYPLASWNRMHRKAIHLHGHMHGRSESNLANVNAGVRRWDVGVDANNYAPVSWKYLNETLSPLAGISTKESAKTPLTANDSHHPFIP